MKANTLPPLPSSSFKVFAGFYRPHLKLFIIDLICAFIVAILDLIFPLFTRNFINYYIPQGEINLIIIFTIVLLALYGAQWICNYIMGYWGHLVGTRIETDMRSKLFRHLQTLPFSFFDDIKTGQIMSRLVGDLREISELAHHGPEDLFISIVMISGSFIILIQTNVLLTLMIFSIVAILAIYALRKRLSMIKAFRDVRNTHAEINSKLESSLSGIRLCKTFANEDYEIENFEVNNFEYREAWKKAYKIMGEYSATTNFLMAGLSVLALAIGGYYVIHGIINYGDLVAYLLYMAFMIKPIRRLIQFTQQYQSGIAGFERYMQILKVEPNIKDSPDAKLLEDPKGNIRFDNVTFKYNGDTPPVLKNFNLELPSGKTIALVGPSGVGKTTIAHLILRFYEVTDGDIKIDDQSIKDITMESLRRNIGFVQQDVFIFYGTLRDNILYGKPEATDEEIITAAKKANIHDFIDSLPEGYESFVGEHGVKLSGGQKQRIAISRVFLKDPEMLILDEATSSLDNATEYLIQESIEELTKNRTTLIIAHRLSTIKNADEILVLADEGIVERGTHDELLEKKGIYEKLYRSQFRGFIPDELE